MIDMIPNSLHPGSPRRAAEALRKPREEQSRMPAAALRQIQKKVAGACYGERRAIITDQKRGAFDPVQGKEVLQVRSDWKFGLV